MEAPPSLATDGSGRALRSHLRDPLYRTSYLLIAGAGITAALGLVFWTAAARSYPAHVVGVNSALVSAMILVSGICQLGLNTVLVRYIPATGERTRAMIIRGYALTTVLSLLFGIVAALTSGLWSPSLNFLSHEAGWLIGFPIATTFWTVFSLQDSVMTGLQAPQWVPLENSLYSLAKLILLVAVVGALPLAGPFVAWNVPVVLAVLGITVLIFRRLIPAQRRAPVGSTVSARQLVRLAAGNYAAYLFSLGVVYLLPVLMANVTNPTDTAYFYAPWIITMGIQVIPLNTSMSMTVEAALDEAKLAELFRRNLHHTMRLLVPVVVAVVAAAPLILSLFGHRYADAGTSLLRLLALGSLCNAVVTIGLAVARVQQRGLVLLVAQAAEFIPLIALTLVLVPSMGIEGVGVAFLASQGGVAIGLLFTILRPLLARHPESRPT